MAKMTFGLTARHIGVIEAELKRFGNREIDAKYVKYIWEKLGKELKWEPFTLALYYFEHLERQEFEDQTREAIDMGGGCSRCGDVSGFECICEQ